MSKTIVVKNSHEVFNQINTTMQSLSMHLNITGEKTQALMQTIELQKLSELLQQQLIIEIETAYHNEI